MKLNTYLTHKSLNFKCDFQIKLLVACFLVLPATGCTNLLLLGIGMALHSEVSIGLSNHRD